MASMVKYYGHKATIAPPNNAVRAKVKPIGCLYPFCACINGRVGCAHKPYDMKREWDGEQYDTQSS